MATNAQTGVWLPAGNPYLQCLTAILSQVLDTRYEAHSSSSSGHCVDFPEGPLGSAIAKEAQWTALHEMSTHVQSNVW